MTSWKINAVAAVGIATLAITAISAGAKADPKGNFQLRGVATWDSVFAGFTPQGATFEGTANAAHLGTITQSGDLFFSAPPDEEGIAPGFGSVTLIAANGDELDFDYVGELDGLTGVGTGTLIFTGGTGRFQNATGTGSFIAVIDLSVPAENHMVVTIEGNLKLHD